MKTDFESNRPILLRLCWLIVQQWKAELAYSRAQYRVSYYRKLKADLETSKKAGNKWNDHINLAKKIEGERLNALKKQEQLLKTKNKLRGPINSATNKLDAILQYKDGKILLIRIPNKVPGSTRWKLIEASEITGMADQHEAEKILTKALTK